MPKLGVEPIRRAALVKATITEIGESGALGMVAIPVERVGAIVKSRFSQINFHREVAATWLNFYVLAQVSDEAQRLLRAYQVRLRSKLSYSLRPLVGDRAEEVADRIAALIDGIYLKHTLGHDGPIANMRWHK